MPRVKRRAHRRRTTWGQGHIIQLQTGHAYFRDESFGNESRRTLDDDLMRAAWEELGDELLDDWITKSPGTRPYAWWRYTAPERRRRIGSMRLMSGRRGTEDADYEFVADGRPHPFDDPTRQAKVAEWRRTHPEIAEREAYRLNFGEPNSLMTLDDFSAVYECEAEYLERLVLLTDAEQCVLSPSEEPRSATARSTHLGAAT